MTLMHGAWLYLKPTLAIYLILRRAAGDKPHLMTLFGSPAVIFKPTHKEWLPSQRLGGSRPSLTHKRRTAAVADEQNQWQRGLVFNCFTAKVITAGRPEAWPASRTT